MPRVACGFGGMTGPARIWQNNMNQSIRKQNIYLPCIVVRLFWRFGGNIDAPDFILPIVTWIPSSSSSESSSNRLTSDNDGGGCGVNGAIAFS